MKYRKVFKACLRRNLSGDPPIKSIRILELTKQQICFNLKKKDYCYKTVLDSHSDTKYIKRDEAFVCFILTVIEHDCLDYFKEITIDSNFPVITRKDNWNF